MRAAAGPAWQKERAPGQRKRPAGKAKAGRQALAASRLSGCGPRLRRCGAGARAAVNVRRRASMSAHRAARCEPPTKRRPPLPPPPPAAAKRQQFGGRPGGSHMWHRECDSTNPFLTSCSIESNHQKLDKHTLKIAHPTKNKTLTPAVASAKQQNPRRPRVQPRRPHCTSADPCSRPTAHRAARPLP